MDCAYNKDKMLSTVLNVHLKGDASYTYENSANLLLLVRHLGVYDSFSVLSLREVCENACNLSTFCFL